MVSLGACAKLATSLATTSKWHGGRQHGAPTSRRFRAIARDSRTGALEVRDITHLVQYLEISN